MADIYLTMLGDVEPGVPPAPDHGRVRAWSAWRTAVADLAEYLGQHPSTVGECEYVNDGPLRDGLALFRTWMMLWPRRLREFREHGSEPARILVVPVDMLENYTVRGPEGALRINVLTAEDGWSLAVAGATLLDARAEPRQAWEAGQAILGPPAPITRERVAAGVLLVVQPDGTVVLADQGQEVDRLPSLRQAVRTAFHVAGGEREVFLATEDGQIQKLSEDFSRGTAPATRQPGNSHSGFSPSDGYPGDRIREPNPALADRA